MAFYTSEGGAKKDSKSEKKGKGKGKDKKDSKADAKKDSKTEVSEGGSGVSVYICFIDLRF